MLYLGYFENRTRNLIRVLLGDYSDSKLISNTNLRNNHETFRNTTQTRKTIRVVNNKVELVNSIVLTDYVVKIDMFKSIVVNLQSTATFTVYTTDLNNNILTSSRGSSYTGSISRDGYLYVVASGTTPIIGSTRRPEIVDLVFSADPVTISQKSADGIFSPLKLSSATVRVMLPDVITELYSTNPQQITCRISNYTKSDKTLFDGYVTPCMYSQGYVYPNDELEIECVSPISTLDEIQWREHQGDDMLTWYEIMQDIVDATGVYQHFFLQNTLEVGQDKNWIKRTYINQQVFKEKDKSLTLKQILENFCKTFGYSAVEIYGELFFIDFAAVDDAIEFTRYDYDIDENDGTIFIPEAAAPSQEELDANNKAILMVADTSATISYDDLYNNINLKVKQSEIKEDIFDGIDDSDELICIHPNIPYITFTSQDIKLYKDTSYQYVDIYRVYMSKKLIHMSYPSKFNGISETAYAYGFDTGVEITPNTFTWRLTTNEEQWKSQFMNYLRSHLCCFIVKHFQYKYDPTDAYNNKEPNKYSWETEYLMSYGMNGQGRGGYKDVYYAPYSTILYNHYRAAEVLPIFKTLNNVRLLNTSLYDSYLQCEGSVMFCSSQDPNTGCDNPQETVPKEDSDVYNSMVYTVNAFNYKVGIGASPSEGFITDDNYYKVNSLGIKNIGVIPNRNRDKMYEAAKELLFNWFPMWDTQRSFKENVIDIKGNIHKIESNYNGKLNIYPPIPYIASNNLQVNFAFMKDIKITKQRSYPIEIAMDGKVETSDKEYTKTSVQSNARETSVDLPYGTQAADRKPSYTSLYFKDYNGNLQYIYDNMTYVMNHQLTTLEDIHLYRYHTHYSTPKFTYDGSLHGWLIREIVSYNTFTPVSVERQSPLDVYMVIDEISYDVRQDIKGIKAIQY